MISLLAKKILYDGDPPQSYHSLSILILAKQLGSKPRERHIEGLITSGLVQVLKNTQGKETYESSTRSKSYRLSPELVTEVLRDELRAYYTLAKSLLAKRGYDPVLGARPLRRTIQRELEDVLSEKMLFGDLKAGEIILVDVSDETPEATFTFKGTAKTAMPDTFEDLTDPASA